MKFKVILFCILVFCSQIVVPFPFEEEEVRHRVNQPNNWPNEHDASGQYQHTNIARPQNRNPSFNHRNARDNLASRERNYENYEPNDHSRVSIEQRKNAFGNHDHGTQNFGQENWRSHPPTQFTNPVPDPSLLPEEKRQLLRGPLGHRGPGQNPLQPGRFPHDQDPQFNVDRNPNVARLRDQNRRRKPYRKQEPYRTREPFFDRGPHPRREPFQEREPFRSGLPNVENPVGGFNNHHESKSGAFPESRFPHEIIPKPSQASEEHRGYRTVENLDKQGNSPHFSGFDKVEPFESKSEPFAETGFSYESIPAFPRFPVDHQGHHLPAVEDISNKKHSPISESDELVAMETKSESFGETEFPHDIKSTGGHSDHKGHNHKEIEENLKEILEREHKRFVIIHPNGTVEYMDKLDPATQHNPKYHRVYASPDGVIEHEDNENHDDYDLVKPDEPSPEKHKPEKFTTVPYDQIDKNAEEESVTPQPLKDIGALTTPYSETPQSSVEVFKTNEDMHNEMDTIPPKELLKDGDGDVTDSGVKSNDIDMIPEVSNTATTETPTTNDDASNKSSIVSQEKIPGKDIVGLNVTKVKEIKEINVTDNGTFSLDPFKNSTADNNSTTKINSVNYNITDNDKHSNKMPAPGVQLNSTKNYTAYENSSSSTSSIINTTTIFDHTVNKTNDDNKSVTTPATSDSDTKNDARDMTDDSITVKTSPPIPSDIDNVGTTVAPANNTLDFKKSKDVTITLNIPANNQEDTVSVSIDIPPNDKDASVPADSEDDTLVVSITTKNATNSVKSCATDDTQNSKQNIEIDLSMADDKPVIWVRSSDEDVLDKLSTGKDKVIYFFNVRPQAFVERDKTKTVYANGTTVIDITETIYEHKDDKLPKIVKTTQIINPGTEQK